MQIKTRSFGTIDIDDAKVITFENGLFGFEQYKKWVLLYDSSTNEAPNIQWLQSAEEELLALPVMMPVMVIPEYNPIVEYSTLGCIGKWSEESITVLVTVTVPQDIKNTSVNLKAPIIVNTDTMKGCQLIAENPDYEIKHSIYTVLKAAKDKA